MPKWRVLALCMLGMLPLLLGITSCGGDDDDGGNGGDTTAPVVSEIEPSDGSTGVSVGEAVVIEFSEAMDQSTADGNITLSSGTITGFTWPNNATLSVAHTDWAEATKVTVTVDTGMTDTGGNHLPQAWTTSFWTESSAVVFHESDPDSGDTDVSRSVQPMLLFSHRMDLTSLQNATTITEVVKAGAVVPEWTMTSVEGNWYRIQFADDLDAVTTYNIAVSTSAYMEGNPSEHLSAAVDIGFTTGTEVDTTPPEIDTVFPAVGATVNPDLTTILITFSEPIDAREDITPSRMSAQLMAILAGEPTWNTNNTELTVFLQPPLPAGVRIFAVFDAGSFQDMAGNANTVTDSISFTVNGSADYFPVLADWEYFYLDLIHEEGGGKQVFDQETKVTFENISGETFDMVEWSWDWFNELWEFDDREFLRKNGDAIWFRGFWEEGGNIMFNPEVKYQELPWTVTTWSGSSTLSFDTQTADLDYEGTTEGQETLVFDTGEPDTPLLIWENCWKSILDHELSLQGMTFSTGSDTIWYAPGVGIVRQFTGETEYDGGVPIFSIWQQRFLQEITFEP